MSNGLAIRPQTELLSIPRMSFDEMQQRAQIVSASGLFKMTPQQALTLMMICDCKGMHPLEALEIYYVFDGKAELKTQFMQAKFEQAGGSIEWHDISNTSVSATFFHPQTCPKGAKVTYSTEDAKTAGVLSKANWKNVISMLSWRVTKLGVNRAHAACIFGFDVPDPEDQLDAPVSPARTALVEHLAGRRENPKDSHPPVAETAAALKEAAKPEPAQTPAREPESEWGKMIAAAVLDYNQGLAELAEANPSNVALRNAMKAQQVINGVVNAFLEQGLEPASLLNDKGKRDPAKVRVALDDIWANEPEDLTAEVAKYLADKMTEIVGPAKAPAQAELAMA